MREQAPAPPSPWLRRLRALLAALVVLLLGLLLWAALDDGNGESGDAGTTPTFRTLTPAQLTAFAATRERPLYWAGTRPGTRLAVSEEAGGRVYVRYLGDGGEAPEDALTVATYPVADAAATIRAYARNSDAALRQAPGGYLVVPDPRRPTSVYLARPGAAHQVEVYAPDPRRALRIALSGDVEPAG